jgi:hypothetical protein
MLGLGESLQYYFCVGPVAMYNGIDALNGVIRNQMGRDPLSGEVFIFMGKCRTRVKLLQWQRGGFVLYYKRLESGKFDLPFFDSKTNSYNMSWSTLFMIIEGISTRNRVFKERYYPGTRSCNNPLSIR